LKTDLAELDRMTTEALDRRRADPPVKKVRTGNIAGFEIFKPEEGELAVEQGKIARHIAARDQVIGTLAKHGVTPLAVLPVALWDDICKRTRLYQFQPNPDGMVIADASDYRKFLKAAHCITVPFWWSFLVAGITAAFCVEAPFAPMMIFCSILAFMMAHALLFWGYEGKPYVALHQFIARTLAMSYDVLPRSWIKHRLFPDYKETRSSVISYTRLVLPTPPADVAAVLEKVQNLPLRIAVVPQGFDLADPPSRVFGFNFDRERFVRQYRLKLAAQQSDPIIYYQDRGIVAIIAQFGDFPIEREAVEQAIATNDLV
jgi:hypothetical protein